VKRITTNKVTIADTDSRNNNPNYYQNIQTLSSSSMWYQEENDNNNDNTDSNNNKKLRHFKRTEKKISLDYGKYLTGRTYQLFKSAIRSKNCGNLQEGSMAFL
jgi:hypothetical protein